jgi:hypothetical protein
MGFFWDHLVKVVLFTIWSNMTLSLKWTPLVKKDNTNTHLINGTYVLFYGTIIQSNRTYIQEGKWWQQYKPSTW